MRAAWRTLLTTALTATTFFSSFQPSLAAVQYGGVNIAGFDFGIDTSGQYSGYNSPDIAYGLGLQQMQTFVAAKMNTFRLPVGWQYIANPSDKTQLNSANWAVYDKLVQACVSAGAAMCIVDLHNYARWNGAVIGQGGPTDEEYATFWAALAAKYANNPKVAFDLMNEPHDLDVATWATTLQATVNAIRGAGATGNTIFLSGTGYSSAGEFVSSGSGPALLRVTDPSGGTDKLVFTVHQYLDSTFSGVSPECSQDVTDSLDSLAAWLRTNSRKVMMLETGGGNTQSCETYVCKALSALSDNSDVFIGATMWSAGAFDPASYPLYMSAESSLFQSCVAPHIGV